MDRCTKHFECSMYSDQGFTCFQRFRDEAVPGCTGIGATGLDYCHNPSLSRSDSIGANGTLPELDFIGDREMELYSLQECQGDCNFDSGKHIDINEGPVFSITPMH